MRLKQNRKVWIAAGATGGAIVGGIVTFPFAPIGVALGANIGGRATYAARKKHENRKLKKFDRKIMLHAHEELKVESHTLS